MALNSDVQVEKVLTCPVQGGGRHVGTVLGPLSPCEQNRLTQLKT